MPLIYKHLQAAWPPMCAQLAATQFLPVVDAQLAELQPEVLPGLGLAAEPFYLTAHESNKTLATCQALWSHWYAQGADRRAVVVAIGGGLTLDVAGWCAAGWKRGVRTVYLPSTLLAQVDAAWGGKTGVNFGGTKNLLGAFHPPEVVLLEPDLLQTLPLRQLRAGLAEALKMGLALDRSYWDQLVHACQGQDLRAVDWEPLVDRAVELKLELVRQDPREQLGPRELLNLGHTLAHALEAAAAEAGLDVLHGEAVAWGLLLEARLAVRRFGLPVAAYEELAATLRALEFPPPPEPLLALLASGQLSHYLVQDKKNQGGTLRFVLLEALGRAQWGVEVAPSWVREVLAEAAAQ